MLSANTILLLLSAASLGRSLPASEGLIGSRKECRYMTSWQTQRPGYKWTWVCEPECVSWQLSDKTRPECLKEVPVKEQTPGMSKICHLIAHTHMA